MMVPIFSAMSERQDQCAAHGEFTASLFRFAGVEHWSGCPVCAEAAKVAAGKQAIKEAADERERVRAARTVARYGAAMIPPRFAGKRLSDYVVTNEGQDKALRLATRYCERWEECLKLGRSLVFLGAPGTGKTHLAAGIANEILALGYTALFRSVPDAVGIIRQSYDGDTTEAAAYARLIRPDLLILDEVGATRTTDHDMSVLFRILNSRYEAQRPTIAISNLKPEDFSALMGDRIVDRLRDNSGVVMVFDWQSHRK